ncbi:MAG: rRNA maturation RNase YbeY [Chloroflexi bacterium RBG_16_54_18]|nr:MAG: rRNA maturation RNase YbeY [Chloroflexi bacterium RBG_16_54_18]
MQLGETLLVGSFPLLPAGLDFLEQAASLALRSHERFPVLEISLLVTDDEQLRDLNHRFMGIDAVTDVLSFPAGEIDPDSQALYLGDVALSLPRAAAQAEAGDHALQSELQLLVVHGVLHLSGYDHANTDQKEHMWEVQAAILSQLGSPLLYPLES